MLQLKEKMYKELELLEYVYGDEIISRITNMVKGTKTYDELLDLIPLVFTFDKSIVILKSINEITGKNSNSSKEVIKYIEDNIADIYSIFNFSMEASRNHIILSHVSFAELSNKDNYNNDISTMLGLDDEYQLNIIHGSIKDIYNLYFKDKDSKEI